MYKRQVLNGAKEAALDLFIAEKIGFMDMARGVEAVLNDMASDLASPLDANEGHQNAQMSLHTVYEMDRSARMRLFAHFK